MSRDWEEIEELPFKGKEEKRRKDEDLLKTVEEVFDKFTLEALYKLINRKVIDLLHGVVDTGKESRVYWAKSPKGEDLAVKIFLTSTREFKKTVLQYIEEDPRFKKIRRATRPLIYAWALKEFKNLEKAYEVGVSVPKPIAVYRNVIVMSFIGDNGVPAPLLKDVELDDYEDMFHKVIENLKILFKYVEEFGDKTPKELKIIDIIRNSLEKSKKLKKEPIKTILGELPGHDYSDVADVCLDILGLPQIIFVYTENVLEVLLSLSLENDPKIKKKALDTISKLAKYTYWPREKKIYYHCLLYTSPSPRDLSTSRMPSSA